MLYNVQTFRGDLFGALTSTVVALPVALALGVPSGMGPVAGLHGAIAVGFFAAVFGGTPSQISGAAHLDDSAAMVMRRLLKVASAELTEVGDYRPFRLRRQDAADTRHSAGHPTGPPDRNPG